MSTARGCCSHMEEPTLDCGAPISPLSPAGGWGGDNRKPPRDLRELLGRPYLASRQDVGPSGRGSLLLIWVGFLLAGLRASWPSPHQLHFSFHQPVQSRGRLGFPGAKTEHGGRAGVLSLALKSQTALALPLDTCHVQRKLQESLMVAAALTRQSPGSPRSGPC